MSYVPTFRWDGKKIKDPSNFGTHAQWYAYVWDVVDSLYQIPSEVRINVDATQDAESIHVKVDVIADAANTATLKLFVAIQEEWIRQIPWGKQYYTFRDMLPNTVGDDVLISVPGDSVHFEYTTVYNDSAYHSDRMLVTAWVQKGGTKKVVNSAIEWIPESATDVASGDAPLRLVLGQNQPNPFNPTTTIQYALERDGLVRLSVYAPTGRLVTELVDGYGLQGSNSVTWNGQDRFGNDVGSGVYYYRLDTDKNSLTRKMILVR